MTRENIYVYISFRLNELGLVDFENVVVHNLFFCEFDSRCIRKNFHILMFQHFTRPCKLITYCIKEIII